MDLVPAIILVGLATVLFWILRTFSDNSTRRKLAETRAAIHRDLVNRFSSTEELVAYLGTDAGRELFGAPQLESTPSPVKRILAAVQTGIILVMVGSACLALNGMSGLGSDGRTGFTFLGAMAVSVGAGFLLSAGASWALSKRWGLIEQERQREAARAARTADEAQS
jgi:hypothetical protein